MVTSRDVASLAGVSQATVSRARSSPLELAPTTLARVNAAMIELGYVPHAGATAMKTGRTHTIGVVVDDLYNPFYAELLDELTKAFDGEGFRVVMWNAGSGSHADALRAISDHAVDGVAFASATLRSVELHAAIDRGRPIVLINRDVEKFNCDKVIGENMAGGIAVADHLISHGRVHAALIEGDPEASTSRDRVDGFLNRMAELGHPVPDHFRLTGSYSHDASAQATRRLLEQTNRPDAIFCVNDNMAFGAIDTLRDFGLDSADCWIIGYDDIAMASWKSFDLTTVRQPTREMARMGAKLLMERISDPTTVPRVVRYPSQLIVRGSTPL